MAIFDIPIPALFESTFNIVLNHVPTSIKADTLGQRKSHSEKCVPYYANGILGREYFMPVKLGKTQLPLPVITLSSTKVIVDTQMVNRDGSVKELISMDDYRMTIRGICLGRDYGWPEEEINLIAELNKEKQALNIECVLTSIFDIEKVIITRLEILETKGFKGAVGYQMELISDNDFTLYI